MKNNDSLIASIIQSRLKIIGTDQFSRLGLSKEEIQLFITESDSAQWTPNMQLSIPTIDTWQSDEEE